MSLCFSAGKSTQCGDNGVFLGRLSSNGNGGVVKVGNDWRAAVFTQRLSITGGFSSKMVWRTNCVGQSVLGTSR